MKYKYRLFSTWLLLVISCVAYVWICIKYMTAKYTIHQLQDCCSKVKNWMDYNRLKMNSDKTEFILIGSKQQLQKCNTKQININSENIIMSETIKYLGTWIDSNLSFRKHITERCKNAMWNLHKLKHIRKFLDQDTCHTLVCRLVLAHLDYAKAVLANLPNVEIAKMQQVQNIAAKLVMGADRYTSPTECRIKLHWLPVRHELNTRSYC